MPRTLTPIYPYDPNAEGLPASALRAQIYNADGTVHGAPIATGFSAKLTAQGQVIPNEYVWNGVLPDDFLSGSVDFLTSTGRSLGEVTISGEFDLVVPDLPVIDPSEELTWTFERFWPAPGVSIPAASTERHLVRVKSVRPDGTFLTALELAAFGIEVAYDKGDGVPLVYHAMQADTVRNGLAATISGNSFYFSLLVGPSAPVILGGGAWLVSVRVASSPRVVRDLPGVLTLTS